MNTVIYNNNLDFFIVPSLIGNNYIPIELLDINSIFKEPFINHRRLSVFANKGFKCEYCNKFGIYLIKCFHQHSVHIDLYTEDFELMTVDHIIPKSKGGLNILDNLVPACRQCNEKKSNKILTKNSKYDNSYEPSKTL
jgi:5-methylcytosine-specific restriction endonuclease McrA